MHVSELFGLLKEAVNEWLGDKASKLSAALAYYSVFSLAPLLVIVISISGLFFGEDAARGEVADQLKDLAGESAASAIQSLVQSADHPATSLLATMVGLVTLLFGASGVFGELKDSLNMIWGVSPKPGRTVQTMIRDRFLSFSMVLGIGFLLMISLATSAVLSAVSVYMQAYLPLPEVAWRALDLTISFVGTTLLFGLIFKVLPDVNIRWRDVVVGAAMTSLVFTIGKIGIGLYLGTSGISSSYGAAGSAIIILLWVYFSSSLLFFGAEFTKVYVRRHGAGVVPAPHAQLLSEVVREKYRRAQSFSASSASFSASSRA